MIADPVLILLDIQNDFCKPGFALDRRTDVPDQEFLDGVGEFVRRYRDSGRTPILVRLLHDGHEKSESEYDADVFPMPCKVGTAGAEFVPELDVQPSDVVVTKHRSSAFFNTRLEVYLTYNDVEELLVGGVSTHVAVEGTVRAAHDRGYDVTVLSDCCASSDPDRHENSLATIDSFFGDVRDSSEIAF